MSDFFAQIGASIDSAIDSTVSTVEGWFAPSTPEPDPMQQIAELQKVLFTLLAQQRALGAKDIDPQP